MSEFIYPSQVVPDQLGAPVSNGFMYFYENGTNTLKTIFADPDLTIAQDNPLQLSAAAEYADSDSRRVYFDGLATVELRKQDDATVVRRLDNVSRGAMSLDSLRSVDTMADLKALTEDDGTVVFVRGYYAVADGGGSHYVFDQSSTRLDDGGMTVAPDSGPGRWRLINDEVLSVEQFGAGSTQSAATNTRSFQKAAAASPRTLYLRDATYSVFPTITGTSTALFDLSGQDGITIDGRGAELSIAGTFDGIESVIMFLMNGSSNITIRNLTLTGTEVTGAGRSRRGMFGFRLENSSENVIIQNIKQTSGQFSVGCVRNAVTEPLTNTCRRILVENYQAIGVGYPLSFRHSGDNVEVRNFRILRCTRAYFPYGCRDHNVDITVSDPRNSPMVDFTVQTRTAESAFLENIRCSVTVIDEDVDVESTWCGLVIQAFPGQIHPATIRNIWLNVNGTMTKNNKGIFTIEKQFNKEPDTVDRGHTIQDVELTGNVVYAVNGNASPIRAMIAPNQGKWGTGDSVRNLRFRNLRFTHPGFAEPPACRIGADSIEDLLVVENCDIPRDLVLKGTLQKGTRYINTTIGSTFHIDTINSVQSLTGNGTVRNIDVDHLLTELRTLAPTTFRLRDGKEGQEKQLVLIASAGRATVRPRRLRGYSTITFDRAGDAAILKFIAGRWAILSNQGCTLA